MHGWKNNNDPWVPLPQTNGDSSSDEPCGPLNDNDVSVSSNRILQSQVPPNPLHQLIDSQRYLETLEKKLEKLKLKRKEPTSKDIITSLALFQEDQMKRYVNSDSSVWTGEATGISDAPASSSSFLTRKLHPEQQALSAEELFELVKSDVVSNSHEEEDNFQEDNTNGSAVIQESSDVVNVKTQNQGNKISDTDSENWANFDEMDQETKSEEFSVEKAESET